MSDNRPLTSDVNKADYNSLTAAINYEYCKKYNYRFVYYRPYMDDKESISIYTCLEPTTGQPRHSSWTKLVTTLKVLEEDFDYIVYIDSDCIFKNTEQSLEDFITQYLKHDILFLNNKPWGDHTACAGFYICQVSSAIKDFFREWFNTDAAGRNNVHPWEQQTLGDILYYKQRKVDIVDSWMFREEEGQFLRHVSSSEKENRIPYFREAVESRQISFEKTISEIMYVEYDTKNTLTYLTNKYTMAIQFVVARYNEQIHWLLHTGYDVILYNKGLPIDFKNTITLPNVGREAHTYLYHIINNYNSLSDVTFFTQARISDHGYSEDLNTLHTIAQQAFTHGFSNNYTSIQKNTNAWSDPDFNIQIKDKLINTYNISPSSVDKVVFCDWFKEHISPVYPITLNMYTSSIFAMKRERIHSRPKEYYQGLFSMLSTENAPIEAHFLERSWFYIFKCDTL